MSRLVWACWICDCRTFNEVELGKLLVARKLVASVIFLIRVCGYFWPPPTLGVVRSLPHSLFYLLHGSMPLLPQLILLRLTHSDRNTDYNIDGNTTAYKVHNLYRDRNT